ncbi:response regulator transcription factor [Methylobacter psychrophilus]|uniref:response regulator transcription factor n=1 Tax=Methylobacter psychrophilus TaxID=96941 RepID=UPI0021D498E4|nr:response regulator [Methylobacter psychrophilus]
MKLLVASSYSETADALQDQLTLSNIKGDLTFVETVDDLINELKKDIHDFIITEYSIDGADIWRLANLINSTQLAAHTLPLFLIKDTCETEIPLLLAKEHAFKVVSLAELGQVLPPTYEHNLSTGYVRGRKPPEKRTLLIIEDDEDAAFFAYNALNDCYVIDIASDGESGLELWKKKRHELVLLDYMLPGIKGDGVLVNMMAIDKNQPVIIMTAYDRPERNQNMMLNGASEYLCKPFNLTDLRSQCQAILNRAKLIYQAHYTDTKNQTLRNQLWLLNHALTNNEFDKAKRVVKTIKLIFPDTPTEDEQADLLSLEF